MATDKVRFMVSRSYDVVTSESAEVNDVTDRGYVFERRPMSLEDVVGELADCVLLSRCPVRSTDDLTRVWASTESYRDSEGNDRTESVHIEPILGSVGDRRRAMFRVYHLAGLA